jgi:hypothetical protein
MTYPMSALQGIYSDQACYLIGKGPSLLNLSAADLRPGPVIALNSAVLKVAELEIDNPVYAMQKDGGNRSYCTQPCGDRCGDMRRVPDHFALLVHEHESRRCYPDQPQRYIFDNLALGLQVHDASVLSAIKIADLFGCTRLILLCFDAGVNGDCRHVEDGSLLRTHRHTPYLRYAQQARHLLETLPHLQATWVTPVKIERMEV